VDRAAIDASREGRRRHDEVRRERGTTASRRRRTKGLFITGKLATWLLLAPLRQLSHSMSRAERGRLIGRACIAAVQSSAQRPRERSRSHGVEPRAQSTYKDAAVRPQQSTILRACRLLHNHNHNHNPQPTTHNPQPTTSPQKRPLLARSRTRS
jgi:hypothetical protein